MASNTYKRNETDELLARIYDAAFAAGYSKRDAEIVRCRECRNLGTYVESDLYVCKDRDAYTTLDEFCSAGEREDKA